MARAAISCACRTIVLRSRRLARVVRRKLGLQLLHLLRIAQLRRELQLLLQRLLLAQAIKLAREAHVLN